MKILTIASQKGGTGKTTLSLGIATAAAAKGQSVAVLDLDPQASAAAWADSREAKNLAVDAVPPGRLLMLLDKLAEAGADLVVIDTPPAADAADLAAERADLVLIPCRPAALDLRAIKTSLRIAGRAGKRAFVVFNAVPPTGKAAEAASAAVVGEGGQVAPIVIRQRSGIAAAMIDGRTIIETEPDSKGADEIRALYRWITKELNI